MAVLRMFVAMLFGTASGIPGQLLCYINGPIHWCERSVSRTYLILKAAVVVGATMDV